MVKFAAQGDEDAWQLLVDRFAPLVWAVARSHGLDHANAADVHQTTWLRLVENLDRLREPAAVAGWLVRTARHESLRVRRYTSRERPTDEHDDNERVAEDETPEGALLLDEERRAVYEAYRRLNEQCQRILRVTAMAPPTSYEEVAAELGIPRGSVGPTRGRCLRHLRRLLEGEGNDD
ncbi:MAG: sigma-70 family RNA polymerase sigma factor [Streptosporangiales bacterium]|nr:sigma-70 family RNA polymerase sigma factor [Streptosporangiales bacterium]